MTRKVAALLLRSLRSDSRSFGSHLIRFGLLVSLLFSLWVTYEEARNHNAPGLFFFSWLASLDLAFVTLAGIAYFSTCIAEEKESGTLSLLKMANIGPGTFIFGKWLPQIVTVGLLIIVQLPFAILSITLGGVGWDKVEAVFCLLMTHLLFMASLGLLVSVRSNDSNRAASVAFMVMLFVLFGPWLLHALLVAIWPGSPLVAALEWLPSATGVWRLVGILQRTTPITDPLDYQGRACLVLSAVLVGWSWIGFERWTSREVEVTKRRKARPRQTAVSTRGPMPLDSRPWPAALAWKEFQHLMGGWKPFWIKVAVYPLVGSTIFGVCCAMWGPPGAAEFMDILRGFTLTFALMILAGELLVLAPRVVRNELVDQTWSTLMMLPRSLPGIVYPRLGGVALGLLPGIGWCGLLAIISLDMYAEDLFDWPVISVVLYCLSLVPFTTHLIALLSLVYQRLAWPVTAFLGAGIVFFLNVLLIACIEVSDLDGQDTVGVIFLLLSMAGLFVTVVIHFLLANLLDRAAAE